jgi:hypothetical protein
MRQFIIAAALALGLVALWAAVLPLTAQPAPSQATVSSPAMSKALFLCRGPNGIDRTCAAALAKALVLDAPDHPVTHVDNRVCHIDHETLASLDRRD